MNTAPKLHEQIKASLEMAWTYGLGEREFPFEKEAIRIAALAPPSGEGVDSDRREFLGKLVRMEWVAWAREQPNAKPSWLLPWEQLTEPEREVDRRIGERIYQVAVIDATTPQSAPVDVVPINKALRLLRCGLYDDADETLEAVLEAALTTTPPPASQERGDADRVIRKLWSLMGPKVPPCCEGCNFEWIKAIEEMRTYLGSDAYPAAAPTAGSDQNPTCQTCGYTWFINGFCGRCNAPLSPPSSAAEHRLEMFTKSPGLHEAGCPLSGTPNLYASCDCGLGAAEQAKPVPYEESAEHQAVTDLVKALSEPPEDDDPNAPWNVAEQAQAGELQEISHATARVMLDSLDDFARMDCGVNAKGPRETLERYINQQETSRLAGGVTVDDAAEVVNECDADVYIHDGAINIDLCLPHKVQLGLIIRPDSTGWAAHGLGYKGHGRHEYGIGDNAFATLVAALGAGRG